MNPGHKHINWDIQWLAKSGRDPLSGYGVEGLTRWSMRPSECEEGKGISRHFRETGGQQAAGSANCCGVQGWGTRDLKLEGHTETWPVTSWLGNSDITFLCFRQVDICGFLFLDSKAQIIKLSKNFLNLVFFKTDVFHHILRCIFGASYAAKHRVPAPQSSLVLSHSIISPPNNLAGTGSPFKTSDCLGEHQTPPIPRPLSPWAGGCSPSSTMGGGFAVNKVIMPQIPTCFEYTFLLYLYLIPLNNVYLLYNTF